ncbi:hypothetical protein [Desulfonema magnum]|uniref:hypothetical protein n=1 Tax=Desulfonema magnum TaxID=45655 RepID=UPI001A9AA8F4|nr:hypothetical protein [Desulfonema magnum]
MQKSASLYFCTPDFYGFCAKKRFALFLHSGFLRFLCKKSLRFIFALRIFTVFMQKSASLYFCTPDLCKKALRSIFALRIFTVFVQKIASLYFCTPDLCKKALRSIFALRIFTVFVQKIASLYFCTPDFYGFMQKIASLYFCTPDFRILRFYTKNRFALFLHSGFLRFYGFMLADKKRKT